MQLRVLFIASDNNAQSGAFRSLAALSKLLKEDFHHEVLVVIPDGSGSGSALLDKMGISYEVVRSYTWTRALSLPALIGSLYKWPVKLIINKFAEIKLRKIIRSFDADIVHINTSWTYSGAKAALKENRTLIWHIREFLLEDQHRKIIWEKKAYDLMRRADRIIAVSKSIYDKYLPILGKDKLTVIYDGIDPEKYFRKRTILNDKEVKLLTVGAIAEGKGQEDSVRAALKLIKEGITDFRLTLIGQGNGEYIEHLRDLTKNACAESHILFPGPSADPSKDYGEADIHITSSRAEAFGRVTVEAMMAGCLAIGTDSKGTAELIKDRETGYLYKCAESDSLKEVIEYVLTHHEEARDTALRGQAYMLSHMRAIDNAESINREYREAYTCRQMI